jgi:hypothetical protein
MRKTMEKSAWRPGPPRWCAALTVAALTVAVLAIPAGTPASGQEFDQELRPFKPALKLAQLRAYSAAGTHQCGSEKGRSCVVTGAGYSSCNDATTTLKTRDCCPTTPAGGKSNGFVLNYCIPDRL